MKKQLGVISIIITVLLLVFVSFQLISWSLFWMGMILMAGIAWLVLPRLKS